MTVRKISVPKLAGQAGNPKLYEALKDIVARSSDRSNEIDDAVSSLGATKIGGTGTPGYVASFADPKTIEDSPLYTDGTNVGLGTTTPAARLHVVRDGAGIAEMVDAYSGTASIICRTARGSLAAPSAVITGTTLGGTVARGYGATAWSGNRGFFTHAAAENWTDAAQGTYAIISTTPIGAAAAPTERVRITDAGNVGIGTNAPARLLHVNGIGRLAVEDKGGQVFNVKAYGAIGNGVADDTAAIAAAITAAAAISPRGVVLFPPGTYLTTGGHSLDGLDGIQIIGSGVGSTVIELGHATNSLFSTANTVTSNITISDFTVKSTTVTRSAGWVFEVNTAYNGAGQLARSRIARLEIRNQFNGLAFRKYGFVEVESVYIWACVGTTGIGIQMGQTTSSDVNQGSEIYLRDVQIYATDFDATASAMDVAFLITDTDAVYMDRCGAGAIYGSCLKIMANTGGHSPSNHFFEGCVFDTTSEGHNVWITGTGVVVNFKFIGCWIASAGKVAGATVNGKGMLLNCASVTSGEITGTNFYNTEGAGLYIDSDQAPVTISGCTFNANGLANEAGNADSIYIAIVLNNLGPVICGNQQIGGNGAGGVAIQTSAGANRLVITGNRWVNGTTYGVAPLVNANNGA